MKHKILALLVTTTLLTSMFLVAIPTISASTARTTLESTSSSETLHVSKWTEYAYNPVFAATNRSYCPSVVYDANNFSGHGDSYPYKMWYNKKIAGVYKIGYAYSNNGINWTEWGAVIAQGYYPIVLYDSNRFGNASGPYYKIWYQAGGNYSTNIYYAESNDGKTWTNTQLVLWYPGNLLNDAYGPDGVLYNPEATNTGSDPMNYSFIMYITCFYTPFATLLYNSTDGISWTVYASGNPNNDIFPARTAAQQGIAYPTRFWVAKVGKSGYVAFYDYFPPGYPAGTREIRCATSPDGKAGWKDISVIFSVLDGVAWRAGRTYQACVLHSEDWSTKWKMWFSGLPADESVYTVGYATADGPYPTIQSAIDAASPGDTIIVHDGTYYESLKINKSLNIIGSSTVVINGTRGSWDTNLKSHHPARAPGTHVYTAMDYVIGVYNGSIVNLTDLVIDGENNLLQPTTYNYSAGVAFYNAGGSLSGCEIKRTKTNPQVCDGAGISIYVDSGSYTLEVDDCEFNTWSKRAIHAYGSGITLKVDDSTFTGNGGTGPAYGLQNGIVGCDGLDIEVTDSTFEEIRATGGSYESVGVMAGYGYRNYPQYHCPAHDLTVSNCTFYNTGDVYVRRSMGVWITTTGTAVVEDCTFTNTDGIVSEGTNNGTLYITSQDVTISHCGFNGPSYPASIDYWTCGAIVQRGGKADIEYCSFSGFHDNDTSDGDGIAFYSWHDYSGSTGGSVKYCNFTDCVEGVYSGTTVTPLAINHNNFDGTNVYGIWNNDGAANIDGRFNWWGHASGPYHNDTNLMGLGDEVSNNVTYSPWLGFVVGTTPMTYHVNPTGKIQDAIHDASSGDTVKVHEGTYTEQLIINKTLTLQGDPGPKIVAPDTRNTYTIAESSATWDPIIFAYGGTESGGAVSGSGTINVTIDGFEIDGGNKAAAAPTRFAAILYRNVNPGVISNNTIHDMYDADGKGDGPETFGILVYGDSNVTIEYNEVRDFSRGGIGVQGDAGAQPDPVGTVKRNTAVGNGLEPTTGWWAENGIQIAWGAGGSIVENNVSDCQVNNPYWASTGILVHYAAPGVNMLDNTVKDCDYGIGVASPSFDFIDGNVITGSTWVGISLGWPVDNCTASNNLVSSNYIGIGVYDGSDNTIENNTIVNNEYGIWIDGDSHNNVIIRNDILNNTQEGIRIESFGGFAPSETVIHYNSIVGGRAGIRLEANVTLTSVKGNVIRDFVKAGIVNRGSTNFTIEKNIISTTIHDEAPNGIDIGIYTGITGTIKDNEISDCSWKDFTGDYETSWSGSGLLVIESGDSLEITNNTVYDCDVGMDIESDSMNITCNDVHSNIYGFVFWNANPVVHRNNIYNNTMYGVYRTPSGDLTGTLDAEYNWWGNATGPYHNVTNTGGLGDRVSDGVDYDPWLDGPIPGDVAIISITPSRNMTCEGTKIDIYVTVKNEGNLTITFNVTLYYDNITIGTQTATDLTPGVNTTLTFTWDTTGVTPCTNYTISAEASTLPCEVQTANNILIDGKVKINIAGDINGDGIVDIVDLVKLIKAYGSYPGHPRWNPNPDLNGDGKVDIVDLVLLIKNFGKTHP